MTRRRNNYTNTSSTSIAVFRGVSGTIISIDEWNEHESVVTSVRDVNPYLYELPDELHEYFWDKPTPRWKLERYRRGKRREEYIEAKRHYNALKRRLKKNKNRGHKGNWQ